MPAKSRRRSAAELTSLAKYIIERADEVRMTHNGGYPSAYVIEHGKVYWADYDAGKEDNAVTLTVMKLAAFVDAHSYYWLDD
jgi:hypothetical protein